MSFATTSASIPVPSSLGLGVDPLQRARPARLARKVVRTSFDLEPNSSGATSLRRLPIGPRTNEGGRVFPTSTPSALSRSLSTSQAHAQMRTPPPPRPPRRSGTVRGPRERPPSLLSSPTAARTRNDSFPTPVSVEKVKLDADAEARETRAQRRHGSIFLGTADETLRRLGHDSLSSGYTLEAASVLSGDLDATTPVSPDTMTTKMQSGASSSSAITKSASIPGKASLPRRPQPRAGPPAYDSPPPRRREVPAPLNLGGESTFHPKFSFEDDEDDASPSQSQPHLNVQHNANAKRRTRRRSRSASIILTPTYANSNTSSSTSPFPTPLTPSFRFEAPYIPEHREKRLNKLAWALGERVPVSMVFPSLPVNSSAAATATANGRRSPRMGLLNRKNTGSRNRTSSSSTIQALDLDSVPRASVMFPLAQPLSKQKKKNARGSSHWQPPAEWEMGPTETVRSSSSSQPSMELERIGPVRRRYIDEEILGVWNADSFDDVLERLRHLK